MVNHSIVVSGMEIDGQQHRRPVIVQMNDDDFPGRFLRDVSTTATPADQISSAVTVQTSAQALYQPVQKLLNVAMVELICDSLMNPPVDPKRIASAGIVIRRVVRNPGPNNTVIEEFNTLSAWMRDARGKYAWVKLAPDQEDCDPDPALRPQLKSGQADVDAQLAAMALSTAKTESTTPAFAAPPATCAALHKTIVYGMIPTASSDVSDVQPPASPPVDRSGLKQSLPSILLGRSHPTMLSLPDVAIIDSRWMSDEFLSTQYPPTVTTPQGGVPVSAPSSEFNWFHGFATALRMLNTVFNAFQPESAAGAAILNVLNRRKVYMGPGKTNPVKVGRFYRSACTALTPAATSSGPGAATTLNMPVEWEALSDTDERDLLDAMTQALTAQAQPGQAAALPPTGRFQDSTRYYRLRMFFRIKPESGTCPSKLVWSQYSDPFQIAPWHASGPRPHPPVPLPDPTAGGFLASVKPNCSFQVPAGLMNAMQGSSLSGLMKGQASTGGGGGPSLGWICGFNIPLITICAFFVLNIFLMLLNFVFFWLPIIKICIPFPSTSSDSPDQG